MKARDAALPPPPPLSVVQASARPLHSRLKAVLQTKPLNFRPTSADNTSVTAPFFYTLAAIVIGAWAILRVIGGEREQRLAQVRMEWEAALRDKAEAEDNARR